MLGNEHTGGRRADRAARRFTGIYFQDGGTPRETNFWRLDDMSCYGYDYCDDYKYEYDYCYKPRHHRRRCHVEYYEYSYCS